MMLKPDLTMCLCGILVVCQWGCVYFNGISVFPERDAVFFFLLRS